MWKKLLAILAVIASLVLGALILLMAAAHFIPQMLHPAPRIQDSPVILKQVQGLSQLVTVKYVMEKVVRIEDPSHWYELSLGENSLLMVAHGIVKAGVNLDELQPGDIQTSGKKISLKLPPARIMDNYLDDRLTEIIDRKTGLLRSFDKDLEQTAQRQAVDDINRAARNGGILKDANERAKLQLTLFFKELGFEEVEFRSADLRSLSLP